MGCFSTHATGTLDPPEVRNWRIHLIALIASMSALASTYLPNSARTSNTNCDTVGYDTAVIGGTMALGSFQRDFSMNGMAKTQRDTTQGNIVSTFQVSVQTVHDSTMSY